MGRTRVTIFTLYVTIFTLQLQKNTRVWNRRARTQLAKGSFIGCTCSKFTVPSSMSRAFSRGIYTASSVIDAGDASLRRIWNLIGFQNVCARIARFSWIFHPSTEKERTKKKERKGIYLKEKVPFPSPPPPSFPSRRKERKNEETAF